MQVRKWAFVGLGFLVALALAMPALAQDEGAAPARWLPGDNTIGLAAGLQQQPAIARGGDVLLAVWADHRSMPSGVGYFYETASDIYGMRLDGGGNPLDGVPFVITQAQAGQENPQVAWNGTHWLVVFESYSVTAGGYYQKSLAAVRVASGGQVVDTAPIPIYAVSPTGGNTWAVASDGTDWVIVAQTSESNSSLKAVRITAAGAVAQPKLLVPSTYYLRFNLRLAYAGGVYLFTWTEYDDTAALRFDGTLNLLDAGPITLLAGYTLSSLASGNSQFYIAWEKTQPNFTIAVTGSRVDISGQKLEPNGVNISGNNQPQPGTTTAIAWEGTNWRVTWGHNNGVRIARVNTSGQVLDPGGVALAGPSTGPTAGTPSGGVQIVWGSYISAENDVYTANVSAGNSAGPSKGLSLGGPMQIRSDVAVGSSGSMVVYRSDISAVRRIMAQPLDGNGDPIGAGPVQLGSGDNLYGPGIPSVAWNGSLYLVAWNNSSGLVARRVLQDGTPVDPAPITVTSGFGPVDVAALGDLFLVVGLRYDANPQWTYGVGARVRGSDGVVLDPGGLALAGTFARWAAVTTLGSRWLAVWHLTWSHDDLNGSTVGSFVNADGTSPGEFSIYGPYSAAGGNGIFELAAAGGNTKALVLTSNEVTSGVETDLVANVVNADGSVQTAVNLTPWSGNQYRPRAAWDGSQFVVVYNEQRNRFAPSTLDQLDARSDLFGMRVTSAGAAVDPKGFAFSLSRSAEAFPNVAASGGISLIAGSVVRNESPYAAYRVGYQRFGAGGNPWPVAVASANTGGGNVPLAVAFSSSGSADPGGSISSYAWDFGDGSSSGQANPSHTYTIPGQYVVTLTVTDNQGAQTDNTVPLAVTTPNQAPVAVATASPPSGSPPLDVTFYGEASYDPDGTLGNMRWQFHDGSVSWGSTAYFSYQQAGVFPVTLTVWDDRNATDTDTISVYVGQPNQSPVAVVSADPTSGIAPLVVAFSSAGSYDPDGTISTYAWAFGDGGTSGQPNPSHTYANAGTYQATLTVTDNQGAAGSESVTITVNPDGCTSNCLRSSNIKLSYRAMGSRYVVSGSVQVRDENRALIPSASVYITWTLPDGSTQQQSAITGSRGLATFRLRSGAGPYTLTVTDIGKAGYTFDPAHSVLSKTLIVP